MRALALAVQSTAKGFAADCGIESKVTADCYFWQCKMSGWTSRGFGGVYASAEYLKGIGMRRPMRLERERLRAFSLERFSAGQHRLPRVLAEVHQGWEYFRCNTHDLMRKSQTASLKFVLMQLEGCLELEVLNCRTGDP